MKAKRATFLTLTSLALVHPLLAFAQQTEPQPPQWNWPGPWHMWSGGWGFWWVCPLFMLLLIIICVAAFFLGHKSGGAGQRHWGPWQMMDRPGALSRSWGDSTYSAMQILNERFAKGEIQKQEYEEKRAAILPSGDH